jgi:hypothetical protein
MLYKIRDRWGQYAGFQHFFQRDAEPLTFEGFVLYKMLTIPEMKLFPDYCEARSKVNKLETELTEINFAIGQRNMLL